MAANKIGLKHAVAAAVSISLAVIYYVIQSWGELVLTISTDSLTVAASGICSLFAFQVVRRFGLKGKFGLVHLGLFLAIFLWFLGETVWAIYEVIFQIEVPYPSLADIFYLGAYIPAALGLMQFVLFFRRSLSRLKSLAGLASGLLIVASASYFLLDPLLASPADLVTKLFDVTYPSSDAVLVTLAVFMFLALLGGKMAESWIWISLGLILWGLGDIGLSLGTLQGWYYSGIFWPPVELLWLWAYVSLALGFDLQRTENLTEREN